MEYVRLDKRISLAGKAENGGPIASYVRDTAGGRKEYPWHLCRHTLMERLHADPDREAVVLDIAPARSTALLAELTDVWGYSYETWTPLAFRMLVLLRDKEGINKDRFAPDPIEVKPAYEFLWVQGGTKAGTWQWGPTGRMNAALLHSEALDYFMDVIQKRRRENATDQ